MCQFTGMESRSLFALFFCFGLGASAAFGLFRIVGNLEADLRVCIWDVGQGDAIWLRFPNGSSWVLDTGGKIGEQSIAARGPLPHLASRGVLKIDRLILSHPDEDHAFGALDWLEKWQIGKLSLNGDWIAHRWKKPLLKTILERAGAQGVAIETIREFRQEIFSAVTIRWIPLHFEKANDRALVLELAYGPCRLLFTGDIERAAETALLRWVGSSHVLKVAHHGSQTSSSTEFLKRVRPVFSIVSVGADNSYGHPHPAVLGRLAASSARVLRTDRHGYVELRVSREGMLHCQTASGFCGEVFCAN
jgi:competence protein ComEC